MQTYLTIHSLPNYPQPTYLIRSLPNYPQPNTAAKEPQPSHRSQVTWGILLATTAPAAARAAAANAQPPGRFRPSTWLALDAEVATRGIWSPDRWLMSGLLDGRDGDVLFPFTFSVSDCDFSRRQAKA